MLDRPRARETWDIYILQPRAPKTKLTVEEPSGHHICQQLHPLMDGIETTGKQICGIFTDQRVSRERERGQSDVVEELYAGQRGAHETT